ncbi:DUF5320 domain-containing protein [Halosquirtibacter laminarini]|uniref:DUF5320 domain-containing protein n=1 Tax=Halosquirtibacter laminarini TaxID=3374600 RepID=A0AC61NJK8_9BACT|nr:DUF5320 domain-containing protein [Prolixibacteraceae bacterium]
MPGLNGKGPKGQGLQTGRGLGRCNANNLNPDTQEATQGSRRGGRRRCRNVEDGNSDNRGQGRRMGFGRNKS